MKWGSIKLRKEKKEKQMMSEIKTKLQVAQGRIYQMKRHGRKPEK